LRTLFYLCNVNANNFKRRKAKKAARSPGIRGAVSTQGNLAPRVYFR